MNFECRFLLLFSTGKRTLKNQNKYSKFDTSKLLSYQGHLMKNLTVLTSFSPSWTAAAVVATSFQPRPPQAWLPGCVALQAMPLRFHELLQTILCFRVFVVSNHFLVAICQCRRTSPFRRAWHTFPRHSHSFFLSAWESRQWRLWYWSWSVPVGDFWHRSFPDTIKNIEKWLLKEVQKGPKTGT